MNILFVVGFPIIPHIGGVQRVTNVLGTEFLKRGHKVVFLCYDKLKYVDYDNYIAHQLYLDINNATDNYVRDSLAKIVIEYSIDRVICQMFNSSCAKIISNLPDGVKNKVVTCTHIMPFENDRLTRRRILLAPQRNLRQISFKIASLIFPAIARNFFNNYEKRCFNSCLPLTAKACFLSDKFFPIVKKHIPNAPTEKFVAIGNPNTFPIQDVVPDEQSRENALLWVGRVENSQKNLAGFLKMWEYFSLSHPGWKAYVVGKGSDLEKYLAKSRQGKWQNLSFEGAQSDVAQYYKKCKYFCMTSFGESWGMVITEAMTMGCVPVAMNSFPTLTDIIDHGKSGIICQPNSKSMADALSTVIETSGEWKRLSDEAVERVKKFDVTRVADKWEALMNDL